MSAFFQKVRKTAIKLLKSLCFSIVRRIILGKHKKL